MHSCLVNLFIKSYKTFSRKHYFLLVLKNISQVLNMADPQVHC